MHCTNKITTTKNSQNYLAKSTATKLAKLDTETEKQFLKAKK